MQFEIREELTEDAAAIRDVHLAAFDGPGEAKVVDLLRANGRATISLVALHQGQVIGHILFSPIRFEPARAGILALGLAPLAVLPSFQNQGAGTRLVQAGLEKCRRMGFQAVIVLGHPNYYPRFGFRCAADYGLGNEYGADQAFMALELSPGVLENINAVGRYAPEFGQADL